LRWGAQSFLEDASRLVLDAESARESAGIVVPHHRRSVGVTSDAVEPFRTKLGKRDGPVHAKLERATRIRDEQLSPGNFREQSLPFHASPFLVAREPCNEPAAPFGLDDRSRERVGDAPGIRSLSSALLHVATTR
jgi:hypothetical protein